MPFKFEQLDVWKMSLDYGDAIYELQELAKRLHAFRHSLMNSQRTISEEPVLYETDEI